MSHRVLSVGQCGYDHGSISSVLSQSFQAEVVAADSAAQAVARLRSEAFDLVLVNRIFDGDGSAGLDLIRALKADPQFVHMPVMLVSNFADAQAEAVAAGAAPGFGKSNLRSPEALERLKAILT